MAADPDFFFTASTRRPRKTNFSNEEINALVSNVVEHQDILFNKSKNSWELKDHQNAIWQFVLGEVNKVSMERRTIQEIKNKWKKYQNAFRNIETVNLVENEDYDAMPLQQRLSHSSTTSNDSSQPQPGPSGSQETLLQSQTITPTKIKVTRQGIKSVPTPPPPPAVTEPPNEEVCLRWNSHHTNMQAAFPNILLKEKYVDTTLVSEGRQKLKCHRMILSACSQYFEDVLNDIGPLQHPVLCMKDVPYWILKALCDFMYAGEVHIRQNKLEELLKVAEILQIKGLAGKPDTKDEVKPIKQEIESIKQEIKEPQPIVKLVKEPLLPHYSSLLKQRETPVPVKEKTPVKETPAPTLRQKGQLATRSSGSKESLPALNFRHKDSTGWREVPTHMTRQKEVPSHVTRQKEVAAFGFRQKETKIPEKAEDLVPIKKPGPKSKTQPQESPQKTGPLSKIAPQTKGQPPKPLSSKTAIKSSRQERGRSHSYTEKQQKELKIPLTKGNINDPLDLLEPVYVEIQKQTSPQQPKIVAKIPVPVPTKKGQGPGGRKMNKKRKHAEEEQDESSFQSRKGTRSRPNVKVPRFYDPSFDQPDATIVREPHTDQTEPLPPASDHSGQTDPFQSIEMEEIKVEPAELEESNLIDAGGNIVTGMDMGQQEQEGEEIIGSYDSPIVNIKKEGGTTSSAFKNINAIPQSVMMNVTTVTDGQATTDIEMIGINKDQLKVVDISRIQRGKSNVDQLIHTPVNNPGIKISNVQTVSEDHQSPSNQPHTTPQTVPEPTPQPAPQPPPQTPTQPAPPQAREKKKRSDKKIKPNPVALRIKEEQLDPGYLPSQSDLPAENRIFIKTEPRESEENECYPEETESRIPVPNPDQIMEIIGVSKTIKKEILDSEEVTSHSTADSSDSIQENSLQKQEKLKHFRRIRLTDPKQIQDTLRQRLAENLQAKASLSSEKSRVPSTSSPHTEFSQTEQDKTDTHQENVDLSCVKSEILEEPTESQNLPEYPVNPTNVDSLDPLLQGVNSAVEAPSVLDNPNASQVKNHDSISLETTLDVYSFKDKKLEIQESNTPEVSSSKEAPNMDSLDQTEFKNIESVGSLGNITDQTTKYENSSNMENIGNIGHPESSESITQHENRTQEMASLENIPNLDSFDRTEIENQENITQEMESLENPPNMDNLHETGPSESIKNQGNDTQQIKSLENALDNLHHIEPLESVGDQKNLPQESHESKLNIEGASVKDSVLEEVTSTVTETQNFELDPINQDSVIDNNTQEMVSVENVHVSNETFTENMPNLDDESAEERYSVPLSEDQYENYTAQETYGQEMQNFKEKEGQDTYCNMEDTAQEPYGQEMHRFAEKEGQDIDFNKEETTQEPYDQEVHSFREKEGQDIDFTKDEFGQDDFMKEGSYQEINDYDDSNQNTQDMAAVENTEKETDPTSCNYENIPHEYQATSSEISSAIANIPGQDFETSYRQPNYEETNRYDAQIAPVEEYDSFSRATYETQNEPPNDTRGLQETRSAIESLQNDNLGQQQAQNLFVTSSSGSEQIDTRISCQPSQINLTPTDEDLMLEGPEESKKFDEALDESLLEDFEDDVVMRDASQSVERGPSPEKTLEMIVNDLNESLGDVRQPGVDSVPQ